MFCLIAKQKRKRERESGDIYDKGAVWEQGRNACKEVACLAMWAQLARQCAQCCLAASGQSKNL